MNIVLTSATAPESQTTSALTETRKSVQTITIIATTTIVLAILRKPIDPRLSSQF